MADERLDYAVLISLLMREEAEVMASALRAEGIDAFLGNLHQASWNWGYVIAFGGVQVMVPRQKLDEAKQVIRERISEAAANPEGEPVGRRDRWKAWAVILYTVSIYANVYWLPKQEQPVLVNPPPIEHGVLPAYFVAPDYLSEAEQLQVLRDFCLDNLTRSVISRENGIGYVMPCVDVMRLE